MHLHPLKWNPLKLSLGFLLLLILFLGCLWVLLGVADAVFEDHNTSFDQSVFDWIAPHRTELFTKLMLFITFFGSHFFLLPANILLILFFIIRKDIRPFAWRIAFISVTSTLVMFGLKEFLKRERPLVPLIAKAHGYSFPSGHTFSSFIFFGMIGFMLYHVIEHRIWRWVAVAACLLCTLVIGFSRIYLQLHYATDVIAGFCLGIIWLLLAKWILLRKREVQHDPLPPVGG